jgi:hypothetical protein
MVFLKKNRPSPFFYRKICIWISLIYGGPWAAAHNAHALIDTVLTDMSQHIEICINKITPVQVGYFVAKNKITVRGRFNLIPNMRHIRDYGFKSQALVSLKKYMPPPLPYIKVNFCPLPLLRFASIFFAHLWSQLYRYTPEIFLFSTATFKYTYRAPLIRIGQEYSANVAFSIFQSLKRIQSLPIRSKLI